MNNHAKLDALACGLATVTTTLPGPVVLTALMIVESIIVKKIMRRPTVRSLLSTTSMMLFVVIQPMFCLAQETATTAKHQDVQPDENNAITELPPVEVEVGGTTISAQPARSKTKKKLKREPPLTADGLPAGEPHIQAGTSNGENGLVSSNTGKNGSGIPSSQVGSAVTVVTGAQLRASQVRHAGEALRSLPGVHVNRSGGASSFTQVRVRGAEGNHTLVLIDGIEANSTQGGEFDFSNLLANDIERIEVIRGGHSGIYGSKAIGGVINIITKSGKGPITLETSAQGGSLQTRSIAGRLSGGTDKMWMALGVQHEASEGFNIAVRGEENDPWRNTTLSVKGGVQIVPGVTLDFSARNVRKFLNFDTEARAPGSLLNVATDAPNTSDSNLFLGGANLKWELLDGALTQVLRTTGNRTDLSSTTTFGGAENLSEAYKFGYLATYRFDMPVLTAARHTISGLIEKQFESFTPRASFSDNLRRDREQVATVAEYRGEFSDRVFISANVRHDRNDVFQDFTTWHSGISVPVPEIGLRPHASVGTSVALPGMFEQFGTVLGVFVGNPDLKPEQSLGWDAGIEFSLPIGDALLDVTYFEANLEDEIRGFGYTTRNLEGESTRRGIEVAMRAHVTPWLYLGAGYTFLDAKEPDGGEEIRRPKHSAKTEIITLFDEARGRVTLSAVYNGDMKDRNFGTFPATVVTLDEYILLSIAASYKIKSEVELFGRVENVLDTDYEEISGYNTAGIAAYAGVRLKLQDPTTAHWAKYK